MDNEEKKFNFMIGLALVGSGTTGVASLVIALPQFFQWDYGTVSLCLIAAALSFGLLANALLRD
jgi:hypothetical protein